ncbi:MAG: hypothetical protein Q9212_001497 [Teloschistes hypoglaucus]
MAFLNQSLYTIYSILQIVLLALWSTSTRTRASIPNAVITLVGFLAFGTLSYFEHQRTIRPPVLLQLYLLITLVFDAARTRTLWMQYNTLISAITTVALIVKLSILSVETVSKRDRLRTEYTIQSPEAKSGLFGKTLFLWLNKLLRTGYRQSLTVEDLLPLDKHLTSDYLYDKLHQPWEDRKKGPRSLLKVFFRGLKWRLLSAVPPRLGLIAFNFCQPFLIERAISFNREPKTSSSANVGYGLIGAYFLVYTGIAITTGQYHHLTYRAITMARGGLVSMMFTKTAFVKANGADPASSLTLMSADIERITNGWQTMHECWANVIEITLAIYLLGRQLGGACGIPIGVAVGTSRTGLNAVVPRKGPRRDKC